MWSLTFLLYGPFVLCISLTQSQNTRYHFEGLFENGYNFFNDTDPYVLPAFKTLTGYHLINTTHIEPSDYQLMERTDLRSINNLFSSLDADFDFLTTNLVSDWNPEGVLEAVSKVSQSMGGVKQFEQLQRLDYGIRRNIQKLSQRVENIKSTVLSMDKIQEMKYVHLNGQKGVDRRVDGSLRVYQEWFNKLNIDLNHLCANYANDDVKYKAETTAQINRIVDLLGKLAAQPISSRFLLNIKKMEIKLFRFKGSINSETFITDIAKFNADKTEETITKIHNHSEIEHKKQDRATIKLIEGLILDLKTLLEDYDKDKSSKNAGWITLEITMKMELIFNVINLIGFKNLPVAVQENVNSLKASINHLKNNDDDSNSINSRNSWIYLINNVKGYFEHLKKQPLLQQDYITLIKRYTEVNALLTLVITIELDKEMNEESEIELEPILLEFSAYLNSLQLAINKLQYNHEIESFVENPNRKDSLFIITKEIENDIDQLAYHLSLHKGPHILRKIRNETKAVFTKINHIMASHYIPKEILAKVFHTESYLIDLIIKVAELDRQELRKYNELQTKLVQLNDQITQLDNELEQLKQETNHIHDAKNVTMLQIKASIILRKLNELQILDYITEDLLQKITKLEGSVVEFIAGTIQLKGPRRLKTDTENDELNTEVDKLNYFQTHLIHLMKNVTSQTDWSSLQAINVEIDSILHEVNLQKEDSALSRNLQIEIEKIIENIKRYKTEINAAIKNKESGKLSYDKPNNNTEQLEHVTTEINNYETRVDRLIKHFTNHTMNWSSLQKVNFEIKEITRQLNIHKIAQVLPSGLNTRIDNLLQRIEAFKTQELEALIKNEKYANVIDQDNARQYNTLEDKISFYETRLQIMLKNLLEQPSGEWLSLQNENFELDTIAHEINRLGDSKTLSKEMQIRVRNLIISIETLKTKIDTLMDKEDMTNPQYRQNLDQTIEQTVRDKIYYFESRMKELTKISAERVADWSYLQNVKFETDTIIYELKLLKGISTLSNELRNQIEHLIRNVKKYNLQLQISLSEEYVKSESKTNCEHNLHLYMKNTHWDLQRVLTVLRSINEGRNEHSLNQLASVEQSLTNIIQNIKKGIETVNIPIESSENTQMESFMVGPDVLILNITEVLKGYNEWMDQSRKQTTADPGVTVLDILLGGGTNMIKLIENLEAHSVSSFTKTEVEKVKYELNTLISDIKITIQEQQANQSAHLRSGGIAFKKSLLDLQETISKYEKDYIYLRRYNQRTQSQGALGEIRVKLLFVLEKLKELSKITPATMKLDIQILTEQATLLLHDVVRQIL